VGGKRLRGLEKSGYGNGGRVDSQRNAGEIYNSTPQKRSKVEGQRRVIISKSGEKQDIKDKRIGKGSRYI